MSGFADTLRRRPNPYIAAAISAVVLIGSLAQAIEHRASILRDGREILLRTEPIDPRDLMRGDYVRLGYADVSSVSDDMVTGSWPSTETVQPVWLTLAADGDGIFTARSASFTRPENVAADEVVLKSLPVRVRAASGLRYSIPQLDFGIERYYVPEGEGLEIEKAQNQGRTTVAVRVSAEGEPQIARLMIDGETLYNEPLY
ncbi:GDYXXLXY domain-containing protein [Hoeflea olei]|uniref:GDYXXLXY domain-containing protein n=1 Tax=Hoeflea olei TaxID=1480615 RepID=A0A1C1YZK9_9HYPH|nr:GDYXXLXY domain-containing protein [Hoeflea olei]OCW58850.1 hypothetical protein AWJ14_20945 [Hoeflea olei]